MSVPFIDLKTQYKALKESIDSRIHKVLDHGAFINGPEVVELEKKLTEFTGAKYSLACANGTDALLMPLMALGIKAGDEVITTAFSFIATAEVICLAGAKPVYVDIDPKTLNIDVTKIEAAITSKTKAIMPVSLYGQLSDMTEINAIAKKHGLTVIEDAAQSFGATLNGQRSCSLSEFAGTSFFPAKPLGCYGDGGALFTNNEQHYKALKEIREHGSESRYYHTRLGINGRLDSIQCAVLLAKLERYQWEIDQRDKIASRFTQAFSEIQKPGFQTPFVKPGHKSVWAQYTLVVPARDAFQKSLSEKGIPTAIHYPRIMPDQPWYKTHTADPNAKLPLARHAADHVVSIPIYPDMTSTDQDKVIEAVLTAMK